MITRSGQRPTSEIVTARFDYRRHDTERWFAGNVFLAKKSKKPLLHLAQEQPGGDSPGEKLRRFIADNGIRVLNVAGPRASEEPEVYSFVKEVLHKVLDV